MKSPDKLSTTQKLSALEKRHAVSLQQIAALTERVHKLDQEIESWAFICTLLAKRIGINFAPKNTPHA